MPPTIARTGAQVQPITTTLKNILQFYGPETCLREILQNADDAGATRLELRLDTSHYNEEPLIHSDLKAFTGPALLAYNNSVFREQDFDSICRIGDSVKIADELATGKFGRGFNSVYHWTDAPQIWSKDRLLIQDPHHTWSAEKGSLFPGGSIYVVDDCEEIQNQLRAFSSFGFDSKKGLPGTIIRVPIRTAEQAISSKISLTKDAVEKADILHAFLKFADELKEGGLLWLKNVSLVKIMVDEDDLFDIRIKDTAESKQRSLLPQKIKAVIKARNQQVPMTEQCSFVLDICCTQFSPKKVSETSWLLSHELRSLSPNGALDDWAISNKLWPWVGVAAPLHSIGSPEEYQGHLFSTLRLPIPTYHPVELHGLFAITPDRARLSSVAGDLNEQGHPADWNSFMFSDCVTSAWANLLVARSYHSFIEEQFRFWPALFEKASEPYHKSGPALCEHLSATGLAVWNTSSGCVTGSEAYFCILDSFDLTLKTALEEIGMPVTYVSRRLLSTVNTVMSSNKLSPNSAWNFLKKNGLFRASEKSRIRLLSYCLEEVPLASLTQVAFWPSMTGGFLSLGDNVCFWPRDREELELFTPSRTARTVDYRRLSSTDCSKINRSLSSVSSPKVLRNRCLTDLPQDWNELGSTIQQSAKRTPNNDVLLKRVWSWISERCEESTVSNPVKTLGALRLIPFKSGLIRKLVPEKTCARALISEADNDGLGTFLLETFANSLPIIDYHDLGVIKAQSLLKELSKQDYQIKIDDSHENFDIFVAWLASNVSATHNLSDLSRLKLIQHLHDRSRAALSSFGGFRASLLSDLRQLRIYKVVQTVVNDHSDSAVTNSQWSTLLPSVRHVSLGSLPCTVEVPNVSFVDISEDAISFLAKKFGLVEVLKEEKLLRLILPRLLESVPLRLKGDREASIVGTRLTEYVFERVTSCSSSWQRYLKQQPLLPLRSRLGKVTANFGPCDTSIDPSANLSTLFFDDEAVFVERSFAERHSIALETCGVIRSLSKDLVGKRALYYSSCSKDLYEVKDRVKSLLSLRLESEFDSLSAQDPVVNTLRTSSWMPAIRNGDTTARLIPPNECRPPCDRDLADAVLPIAMIDPDASWLPVLGWATKINIDILVKQLQHHISRSNHHIVHTILQYILTNWPDQIQTKLKNINCIRGSSNIYLNETQVFHSPVQGLLSSLSPYFDTCHSDVHQGLLKKLQISKTPKLAQVLDLQMRLSNVSKHGVLEPADLHVALASVEVAVILFPREQLNSLCAPNEAGKLVQITKLTQRDRPVSSNHEIDFVHPRISLATLNLLGIEGVGSWSAVHDVDLGFMEDEDEFSQEEQICTTISNSLERYPLPSFLGEYLANADDAGASMFDMILDQSDFNTYPSKTLPTKNMAILQGPSMFIYNDRQFSENDWKGFRNVGIFGRGSLTAYHITPSPQLISGKFLMVLDPSEQILPRSKITGKRKGGIKVSLEDALNAFPDILAPFYGVCGFSKGSTEYSGTLFRLPLQPPGCINNITKTTRWELTTRDVNDLLYNYALDAAASLLFLQNVQTISYRVKDKNSPVWTVQAKDLSPPDDPIAKLSVHTTRQAFQSSPAVNQQQEWWILAEDIESCPSEIQSPSKRSQKRTECGIALLKSQTSQIFQHRIFCSLPTPFKTELPISFNASFAITSDRETIPLGGATRTSETAWNLWLLTERLPSLWLQFLGEIAKVDGALAYQYWPRANPSQEISSTLWKGFWTQLEKPEFTSFPLFPIVAAPKPADTRALVTSSGRKLRKLPTPPSSFATAEFDFLRKGNEKLTPFLRLICQNLVQIPWGSSVMIEKAADSQKATTITSDYLRKRMREDTCHKLLQTYLDEAKDLKTRVARWNLIVGQLFPPLFHLTIQAPSGKQGTVLDVDLDLCQVLPLRDGSFARLRRIVDAEHLAETYFDPDETEEALFQFALDMLVDTRYIRNRELPFWTMIDQRLYNVESIQLEHIEKFLNHKHSPLTNSAQPKIEWLAKFWSYINTMFAKPEESSESLVKRLLESNLGSFPLIGAYHGKEYNDIRYFSLEDLLAEEKPLIIEPSLTEHRTLCQEFPELWIIPVKLGPAPNKEEGSLSKITAFDRLLRKLQGFDSGIATRTFSQNVSEVSVKTWQGLFKSHRESLGKLKAYSYCKTLPIFPRLQSRGGLIGILNKFISITNAQICSKPDLLHPWLENLHDYIDPAFVARNFSIFNNLGSKPLNCSEVWSRVRSKIPQNILIEGQNLKHLLRVLGAVVNNDLPIQDLAIVPDCNGRLRPIAFFWDPDTTIFVNIYRNQLDIRFMHPNLRNAHRFWKMGGMHCVRSGSYLSEADYMALLKHLSSRPISDSHYLDDCRLLTSMDTIDRRETHNWSQNSWRQIAEARLFPVEQDFLSRPYATARMTSLAANQVLLSPRTAARKEFMAISWSQQAYIRREPFPEVYSCLKKNGAPPSAVVLRHIIYLVGMTVQKCDLVSYLEDLESSYGYLQDNYTDDDIKEAKGEAIFLNLRTTQKNLIAVSELQENLVSADMLCLYSKSDPRPFVPVNPFLFAFEKLLLALDCKKITETVLRAKPKAVERTPEQLLMQNIRQLRHETKCCDITLGVPNQSKRINAHRVILAANSDFFMGITKPEWNKNHITIPDEDSKNSPGITIELLEMIVDYCYSGEITLPVLDSETHDGGSNEELAEKLDQCSELLYAADFLLMPRLTSIVEAFMLDYRQVFIRADNVREWKTIAEECGAKDLLLYCCDFELNNLRMVEHAEALKFEDGS
ncbi:MAG: hypothetical protein M1814_002278 [Vezdaea aestivalis]|nr:MAG: hypothetical protein M1814_002278 [Vezdaea aestivalis]